MKNITGRFLKIFNIISVFAFVLSLCACTDGTEPADGRISVVAVNFAQYDFARAVCGEEARVKMIIRPGAEVHGYEPSLSDILAIENADVFIYGGGESDIWVDRILSSVDTSDKVIIPLMEAEGISLYREELHTASHSHDGHSHEHTKNDAYDEHIWTSPKNAARLVEHIASKLIAADSENKAVYSANADEYIKELKSVDAELKQLVAESKTNYITVADRFPFLYLAKDYGIEYMAAFSGCSPESDAGPSTIAKMTEEIKHRGTDAVFYIELSNAKMADALCEQTGAKKRLLHSCQSISKQDFESGVTYAELMHCNLKNLREAMN